MAKSTATKGICLYCKKEFSKGGIAKHFRSCAARREAIAKAETAKRKSETLYHLRIQDAYLKDFWLNIEIRGSKKLIDLDDYLRAIWLECCGHFSEFFLRGRFMDEVAKNHKINQVFEQDSKIWHIYDMGTSSETIVSLIDTREGKALSTKPLTLMARNNIPEVACIKCDQPATHLCLECMYEDEIFGALCDRHTKNHPHDDYGEPIPIVNSPRLGMCGYEGPAISPY